MSERDGTRRALQFACRIIETGDQRTLASDGPAGNQPPDLTLSEWKQLYKALRAALQSLTASERQQRAEFSAICDEQRRTKAELTTLRAECDTEIAAEKQRYFKLMSDVIDATGVEVPARGITATEAVQQLRAALATAEARVTELDAAETRMMEQRDHAMEMCDMLSGDIVDLAVGGSRIDAIGEHSNGNDPWEKAHELSGEFDGNMRDLTAALAQAQGDVERLTQRVDELALAFSDAESELANLTQVHEATLEENEAMQDELHPYRAAKAQREIEEDREERGMSHALCEHCESEIPEDSSYSTDEDGCTFCVACTLASGPVITRLRAAECRHTIKRDRAGNAHVTIHQEGKPDFSVVAPTFDEAVTRALDLFESGAT